MKKKINVAKALLVLCDKAKNIRVSFCVLLTFNNTFIFLSFLFLLLRGWSIVLCQIKHRILQLVFERNDNAMTAAENRTCIVTLLLSDFSELALVSLTTWIDPRILFLGSSPPIKNQDMHRPKNYSKICQSRTIINSQQNWIVLLGDFILSSLFCGL